MPSADQVPVNCTHSTMLWPVWADRRIDRLCITCCSPFPTVHITPDARRDLSRRECDGFFVTLASDHHCPHHSANLVGERDGSNLGRTSRQQGRKPGSMLGAVEFRIADDGERTGCEQAAQITIALLADTPKLVFAPARVLLRHKSDPGREVPSRSKRLRIGDACNQSCRQRRTNARDRVKPLARLI